jgi:hypothetical protein
MADYKAVSTNVMHADIRVTDGIYAPLLADEVKSRIGSLSIDTAAPLEDSEMATYLRRLSRGQKADAIQLLARDLAR